MLPPAGTSDGVAGRHGRRGHRVIRFAIALALLAVLVVGVAAVWAALSGRSRTVSECRVVGDSAKFTIDLEQAANATTITAVGKQLGMIDHAVTIALATALQESNLHNLRYGDRDSLGLFQQRPSQGWGTPAQLMDPRYAATAFFKALNRVPDWQSSSVTDAAQAVQRSNAPEAYARWEPLARTLARATTGELPAALTCQFALAPSHTPPPSPVPAMTRELGAPALDTPVSTSRGWTIAGWLVAHAEQYRITSVRFAAREWTSHGRWKSTRPNETVVRITQSPPAAG
ncbi:MAG TPA: hypothetical protein VEZ15_15460 [Acidimicrobiia bacterium]|nr:hypothetical protein [Acidimicrobiia bacterium]